MAVPKECYGSIGRHRRVYATNYHNILLLVEDKTSNSWTNVTLQVEVTKVNLPLQQRSPLNYLDWAIRLKLGDLSSEVRRTRCLQSLHDDYSLHSGQPGWRVISRGEVLVLVRCHHTTVRPILSSPTCSQQLSVQDEDGNPWRLHAGNRLLTDLGVKVPCGPPFPVYTFLTQEGRYVQQSPVLEEVFLNFTAGQTNSMPSFLAMEEDKILFPSTDPFKDPGGLYPKEEMEGTEDAFLREWSILTGLGGLFSTCQDLSEHL